MLMKRLIGALVCATFAVVTAAADSTLHAGAEQTAIEHARTAQNAAILRHDVDAVASFWTDDVTICRGLGTQLAGKAAYRQLFLQDQRSPAEILYQRHATAIEVSGVWPLAFETGLWEGRQGKPTGPVVVRGRYSAQWVKRGDAWLIRSEVFVALQGAGAGLEMKAAP
jgi:ketosteroid isomerase-like protein